MPVMTGMEAIAEIRRLQNAGSLQGNIPVLAVTANARPEQIATVGVALSLHTELFAY
jgi:CheY-like chemotaxis protein